MRRWEIELRVLADDFCVEHKATEIAIKKAKEVKVPKSRKEPTFRYEYGRRLLMPYILTV